MSQFPNLVLGIPRRDGGIERCQPIVQRKDSVEFTLRAPYAAVWDGGRVDVPDGFVCDLSSIPRVLHVLIPKTGLHDGPSVIHDWLYENRKVHGESKPFCDDLFLYAMAEAGVFWLRRNVMYAGVVGAGHIAWYT